MTYILRVYKKGRRIERYDTGKYYRFLHYTRLIFDKFDKQKDISVYIKINYGYGINVFGERVLFHNDGTYYNKTDLKGAVNAFTERG